MSSATKAPGGEGPGDWVLVPRDPLPEMLGAFWRTKNTGTTEIGGKYQDSSDVAAYRAMIAAAPSNTTAPTPTDQVGEDVGRGALTTYSNATDRRRLSKLVGSDVNGERLARVITDAAQWAEHVASAPASGAMNIPQAAREIIAEAADLFPASDPDVGFTPFEDWRLRLWKALASAPAPSDPAGAGGDLGELERLSKAATPGMARAYMDKYRLRVGPEDSTFETEFTTVAVTSTCDKAGSNLVYLAALWNAHRSGQLVASTPGQKGAGGEKTGACLGPLNWQLSEEAQAHIREIDLATVCPDDPRLSQTLIGPAGPAAGMDGYGSQARPLTPAQTPPSPPSATPEGEPPMTVEEARDLLLSLPRFASTEACVESLYLQALRARSPDAAKAFRNEAGRIELALRTLQASESPSTKEASDA